MSKIEVTEMGKSDWIKESQSLYSCKSDTILIGREHQGDENGKTRYTYGCVFIKNTKCTVEDEEWSSWVKESDSYYRCPVDRVFIGREHEGDENGKTRYRIATLKYDHQTVIVYNENWSEWFKESNSDFICPDNTVIIGREHRGDENGNTRYQYAELKVE